MADSVRGLTVDISLQDNFSKNMKSIQAQVKEAEAAFTAAGAGIDDFGRTATGQQAKIQLLTTKFNAQKQAVYQCQKQLKTAQDAYQTAQAKTQKLREELDKAKNSTEDNADEVKRLESALAKAEKAEQNAATQVARASAQLQTAEAELGNIERQLETASSKWTQFGERAQAAGEKMTKAGKGITQVGQTLTRTVTGPIVAAGTAAVATFTGYDDALKQVQATMGLVAGSGEEADRQIALLDATAKEMGVSTRYSASEAAAALNYLALAGYSADEACAALPQVLALAQAGGMDLASASDLATDAMAALGLEMSELGPFTDQLAKTSQKSNTSVSQLGEAILTVGATAKVMRGGVTEANTALGVLANRGIKGSEGGTALRNVLLALTAPTDKAAKQLKALGVSVTDASGEMRPLNEIMGDLDASLEGMTDAQKQNVLSEIFNKRDLASAQALMAGVGTEWDSLMAEIAGSDGAAQQMADTMESGIGGAMRSLKSAVEGLGISFGETLAPHVQSAAKWVTDLTRRFASLAPQERQQIVSVAGIAAAIGPVTTIAGKAVTTIGQITTGIGKIATGLGSAGGILGVITKIGAVMTGPAGLVVGTAAMLGVAIHHAYTQTHELEGKLKNLNAGISEEGKNNIIAGIDAAIGGAQQIIDIKAQVSAEWAEGKGLLDSATSADGSGGKRVTWNEKKQLTTWVENQLEPDLAEAKAKAQSMWQEAYDAAIGVGFTPEEATQQADSVVEASGLNDVIAELTAAEEALKTEIGNMYNMGANISEADIERVKGLMQEVETLQAKLGIAKDDAARAAQNAYTAAMEGATDETTNAKALGVTKTTSEETVAALNKEEEAAYAARDAMYAQAAALEDSEQKTAALAQEDEILADKLDVIAGKRSAEAVRRLGEVEQTMINMLHREGFTDQDINDYETMIGLMEAVADQQEKLDKYKDTGEQEDYDAYRQAVEKTLSTAEENGDMLARLLPEELLGQMANARDTEGNVVDEFAQQFTGNLFNAITDKIGSGDYTIDEAMQTYLAAMKEEGLVTPEDFDEASGSIATALKQSLISQLSELGMGVFSSEEYQNIGSNVGDGVITGLNGKLGESAGAGDQAMAGLASGIRRSKKLAVDAAGLAAQAVVDKMRNVLQIQSPSKVFAELGEYSMMGFGQGFEKESRSQAKAVRNAARWLTGGLGAGAYQNTSTRNYNANSSLNVQTMVMQNGMDAQAMIEQMNAYNRRILKGYGG